MPIFATMIYPTTSQGSSLIRKYNVPGPRYTSYPTVPFWSDTPSASAWEHLVKDAFDISNTKEGISIYIHLPYCESLCTYCACNTRITINHKVESTYIKALLKEWRQYLAVFKDKPIIKEMHLGGGTPTFFSPSNLKYLLESIFELSIKHEDAAYSFEAHPKNTTKAHLQTLYDLGFKRLSLGIQDFDPKVQKIVNRVQPFEMVEEVVNNARAIGYDSINFDLIYGLPLQTAESVKDTIEKVNRLRPERIAFYSYAHVPWVKPGQRMFTELDLPADEEKRHLYELGKLMFEASGYVEIGMDHFALPNDSLYHAMKDGELHRNFMGYTSFHTTLMVGLGASSISDSWTGFVQNIKKVEDYIKAVEGDSIPFYRGHVLSEEDLLIRKHILELMCHFQTNIREIRYLFGEFHESKSQLREFEKDGLIVLMGDTLRVTEKGRAFVRNICMILDAHLRRSKSNVQLFSQTV